MNSLYNLAAQLGKTLEQQGRILTTAESCTGGWIAKVITDVPGSSGWFEYGFVTYSNKAKEELLSVAPATLEQHGAVSAKTVTEMAQGALKRSRADLAVAVSGVAGPDGGSPDKPVGTVWLAWAVKNGSVRTHRQIFPGDRDAVRRQTVTMALEGLLDVLNQA